MNNIYTNRHARIWLTLERDGEDLCPDELDVDEIGDRPEWLGWEFEAKGGN